MIKKTISRIIEIGLKPEHKAIDKKIIKSFNTLTVLGILINFILCLFMFNSNNPIIGLFHVIMALGYMTAIYLHVKLSYNLAVFLFWGTNILYFILFSSVISKENLGIYFSTMLLLAILFLHNNWVRIIVSILVVTGFYLKSYYYDTFFYSDINHPLNNALGLFFLIYYIASTFKHNGKGYEIQLEEQYKKAIETQKILDYQKQELKKLDELKSHFLINLSHEIRTPITLINGYTSKLDFNKSKTYNTKQISVIKSQLYQIQGIVDSIMDLGKMDSNQLVLNKSVTSLHTLLSKQLNKFKPLFTEKSIDFSIQLPLKDVFIHMDALQIERCIVNLLSNTLKFSIPKGKVLLFAKHIHAIEIGVLDNGIGIPSEDINNIFNRFFQSKNHITKSQGSGIGLSFTKSIVEEHGFSIHAESTPYVETRFTIKIPEDFIYNTTSPKIKQEKNNTELFKNTNAHVLVVDDHEQMRSYLKSLLPDNIKVYEAENGLEAKKLIENKSIDLIITDYMMPIVDGYNFVDTIKKLGYKTPVIVVTARVDNKGKLDMLRLGIDAYLTKPFLEEEFTYTVNKSLNFYKNIIASEKEASLEELQESNETSESFYKTLLQIISQKYNNHDFGIDDLAETIGTSKRTLNRKTKLLLGQTPNQIIIEVRLQKAMKIKETQPDISKRELAKLVGLSNASYLSMRMDTRFGIEKNHSGNPFNPKVSNS